MLSLLVTLILIIPTLNASADDAVTEVVTEVTSDSVTEPIYLLLWAASDPKEDRQVAKIDPVKFYRFTEKYREKFVQYYDSFDIIGATQFIKENSEESGTSRVIWSIVTSKIIIKKINGITEDKEHGLPSLVAWAVRNTGPGTKLTTVTRETLVSFLLAHKTDILKFQHEGDVDGLVNFLDSTKAESTSNDVDWKTIINELKDNRQLFKSSTVF